MSGEHPTRSARGRVIVVGAAGGLDELSRTVVRAENLFDAVGEVTVATASDPVEAVVVPSAKLEGAASITVEAFRRIDPSVRLILLAPSAAAAEAQGGEPDGFDEVLIEPLTGAQLARVLGNGDRTAVTGPDGPAGTEPDRSGRALEGTGEGEGEDEDDELLPDVEVAVTQSELPEAAELGDTDLVEAILGLPRGVRDHALALMSRQTGWTDLELTDEAPSGGRACAEVQYRSRRFGFLSTGQARPRQVRPWAEWLAHWLALDARHREYRLLAYRDELTGAWNRRYFHRFMTRLLERAARQRRHVTILVFDIDDFKLYNDRFGHEAGDEILRETVRLLNSVIRTDDRVCRIGGDEFVVVFSDAETQRKVGSNPPETVEQIATRFQDQICQAKFPKLGLDAPGTLSVSGGLATYPWDGTTVDDLLRHADRLALESKRAGKNVITLGPGTRRSRA